MTILFFEPEQSYILDSAAHAIPGEQVQVFAGQPETLATATNNYKTIDGVLFRQFIWFKEPANYNTVGDLGDDYFSVRFAWDASGDANGA